MRTELKTAFFELVDLEPAEQQRRLAALRADDPALAAEVEGLLQADSDGDDLLQAPIASAISQVAMLTEDPWVGRQLGPWTITQRLAAGGMGTVFRAKRSDDSYRQQVAIKIMGAQLLSPDALARFRAERQILANLKHPGIAQLLDGGATDNDLPYLVMEYIDGRPIDAYCDELSLGLRKRIELFLEVCDAVAYAHRQLVVHRDLKPGNILVESGRPKLLDFGIAKLIEPPGGDAAMLTREGQRILTPAYASPEQARGETITVASDVYSLGVLLYSLLCGRLPLSGDNLHGTARETTVAPRPSTMLSRTRAATDPSEDDAVSIAAARGTTLAKLSKALSGDLDNIALTALHEEPDKRYATVNALADDLRNYLAYRPVSARAYSFAYRSGKFLRRNAAGVAAAFVLAVLATAFTVSTVIQNQRITAERDAAERERNTAERVTEFLVDLFEMVDPDEARGRTVTARAVVDSAAERLEDTLLDEPVVRAELRHTLGRVYANLGQYDDAEALLTDALAEREQVHGAGSPEVADTLFQLGYLREFQGNLEAAQAAHERALAIREQHADTALHADSLFALGGVHLVQRNNELARELLESSLTLRLAMFGEAHADVGRTLNDLAILDWRNQDFARATERWRRALEINEASLGKDHPTLRYNIGNVSFALSTRGYAREALPYDERSLALAEATLGPDHPQLVLPLTNLAVELGYLGEFRRAQDLLARAISLMEETDHYRRLMAQTEMAEAEMYLGDFDAARELLSRASADLSLLSGEAQLDRSTKIAVTRARVELAAGNATAAAALAEAALELIAGIPEWGSGDLRRLTHRVLALTSLPDNPQAAIHHSLEALRAGTTALGKSSLAEAVDLIDIAALLRDLARPEAQDALRQLRDVLEKGPPAGHPVIVAAARAKGIEL